MEINYVQEYLTLLSVGNYLNQTQQCKNFIHFIKNM